ncbi:hypothetical protein GGR56DRAFT_632580 [Xylariaceae sp. FL0804]|nr:hypothetical protein GGR56DRAFT_632580 [Xylariaceae sp. FL0804]
MASRPALAAAGCSHCRSAVLSLFTTRIRKPPVAPRALFRPGSRAVGLASTRTRPLSSWPAPSPSDPGPPRPFEEAPVERGAEQRAAQRVEEQAEAQADGQGEQQGEQQGEGLGRDQDAPDSEPWYLQVDPPRHVAPMEPPPLPEVPAGAPSIMGPLLAYAAEEMGLDELRLLDLRALDPPPALGSNLLMLFGTARGERHLNVSAGRLVRWLRFRHRIYADADGLLGPNERKTKLRRKAKRARLLGTGTSTMGADAVDDGITTGWICVNLGNIGRGGEETAIVADDGRVAGFGLARMGSAVVVQIMTASRRAELGLEALWTKALDKSVARQEQEEQEQKAIEAATTRDSVPAERQPATSPPPSTSLGTP